MSRTTDIDFERPYCLRCYGRIEFVDERGSRRVSVICGQCGFTNVREDQRHFWTKEPWLVELEGWAKAGTLLALIAISWGMSTQSPGGGSGQGWVLAFPILAGTVLWQTAEKITRWRPYFRAGLFWALVPAAIGVLMLSITALAAWASGPPPWRFGAGLAAAFAALGLWSAGIWLLGRRLDRWRSRRIARGQDTARRTASDD